MKEEINKLTKIITGKNAEITLLKADKDSLSAKLKAKQEETKKLNEELKSCRGW